MTASFVNGVGGKDPSNTTNHTITVPSGVQVDDVLVFVIGKANSTGTINTPAGWTAAGSLEIASTSEAVVFLKIATSSEDAGDTITVTFSSGISQIATYALLAFRGIDLASIVVGSLASAADGSAGTTHTVDASAISPVGDAVAIFLSYFTGNAGTFNATPPTGFTEGAESGTGSSTVGAEAGYKLVSAGSLGSLSSSTQNNARGLNFVIALNAAAVPAEIPLGAASGAGGGTLALTAATQVALDAVAAQASPSLSLITGIPVPLGAASGQASASLQITIPQSVPLDAASAQASASLALATPSLLGLDAAAGQSSAALAITPAFPYRMTAAFSEVSDGNAFLSQLLGPRITETFEERWASGEHTGAAKPELRVEIRQGRFNRRRAPWNRGVHPIDAVIADTPPNRPWQAFWEPTTDYVEVPNVLSVEFGKNFDQRGVETAVITIENIVYSEATAGGEGGTYHVASRGYLSPLRGYVADGQEPLLDERGAVVVENEWFQVLNRNYQITVHQAYGDESVKTFTGLIDEVDTTSRPATIVVNARSFGQALSDEELFGWNKDVDLRDPLIFIDKDEADTITKVGTGPQASSNGGAAYQPELVIDGDSDTYWRSNDHTGPGNTEWVSIDLPQGRYEDIWLGTEYPDMEVYISIWASPLSSGGSPTRDGVPIPPDWVDTGLGTVPGAFGGIPYVRKIPYPPGSNALVQIRDLDASYHLGSGSILRVSFRNLYPLGASEYRAAVRSLYGRKRSLVPEAITQKWIRVGDLSDIVKVLLRWAGFKEWEIESTGAKLGKRLVVNRQMKYMDVIDKIKDGVGYEFFVADPTDWDLSIGVPVFRKSQVLNDDPPITITVTGDDVLTAADVKQTDEPLAYIIRARGRESPTGVGTGSDRTKRIQYEYRPPWSGLGLAGLLKHVIHTDPLYRNGDDVKFAAWYIAAQEALASLVVGVEIPGYPGIDLDDMLVLRDLGTGLTTRGSVQERRSTMTVGEQTKWTTTLTVAVVDVPDLQTILALIRDARRDDGPPSDGGADNA